MNYELILEHYQAERPGVKLNMAIFECLLITFPAILVAQADGHIDTIEVLALNKIATHLGSKLGPGVDELLKVEIRHLGRAYKFWRKPFLDALKQMLIERPISNQVVDYMLSAASASTGNLHTNILYQTTNPMHEGAQSVIKMDNSDFISDDEKKEIKNILEHLGLENDAKIKETLKLLL